MNTGGTPAVPAFIMPQQIEHFDKSGICPQCGRLYDAVSILYVMGWDEVADLPVVLQLRWFLIHKYLDSACCVDIPEEYWY